MNLKKKAAVLTFVIASLLIFTIVLGDQSTISPRGGPYVDSHWFSMIIGPDAQLAALREHQVAAGGVPRPEDIATLRGEGFTLNTMVRLGQNFLFENNRIYPCDDINFRKAINRLVDTAALTDLLFPLQSPMTNWLPPSMGEWVNPDTPLPAFNPGMPTDTGVTNPGSAYAYLNDAGYTMTTTPNPWATEPWASPYLRTAPGMGGAVMDEIEYVTRPLTESPLYYEHSLIINEAFHQAGINTRLTPKTWSEIVAILVNSDLEDYQLLTGVGIVWGAPEPDIQYDFYRSDQIPLWNVWNLNDTTMDAACDAIKSTLNYTELKAATYLTQEILYEQEPCRPVMMYNTWTVFEGPYVPLGHPGHIGIVNDVSSGAASSYNIWGYLVGDSGWTKSPEDINVWYLGGYLDTLNPTTADTTPDWAILNLVVGAGGWANAYTAAYMACGFAQEPTQTEWDGVTGHVVTGSHMYFELKPGLKWQDGEPITAEDAVFGLNLMRFQDNDRYRSTWQPIYDVVQTGTYTWEVYYDQRYYFAARAVGEIGLMTPKHIWEGFIQPTVSVGTGPMGGDDWTATVNSHVDWHGWENSLGADTYNGYPGMELTELIGFGPYIYHLGGWVPGIQSHVEANPNFMDLSSPTVWCPGDVNKNQFTDGIDIWHVLRRIGYASWMTNLWYEKLGVNPWLTAEAADIYPSITGTYEIIDFADNSVFQVPHSGHWSGFGDAPLGWLKEPSMPYP